MNNKLIGTSLAGFALLIVGGLAGRSVIAQTSKSAPQVITLTQTACQFVESESKNYKYTTAKASDCEQINAKSLKDRQKGFKPLRLKAGEYVFRVTNTNVPYELGFYLRGTGLQRLSLPNVSGGGLTQGMTKEYRVTLRPGTYVYSCPLNPTPDYPLIVQ